MVREPDEVAAAVAFEAAVQRRDEEAKKHYRKLPRKQRNNQRAKMLAELYHMQRGDRESRIFQTIDKMAADLKAYKEKELRIAIPEPKFKHGQSVLQWWSPWMKTAEETPTSFNGKNRPAWFSAEVTTYKEFGEIVLPLLWEWTARGRP